MSKQKQRVVLEGFSFSVKKLILETDVDMGSSALAAEMRDAIGQVMSTPAKLLTLDAANGDGAKEASSLVEPNGRRRRRRVHAKAGTQAQPDDRGNGGSSRSQSAKSARGLVQGLMEEGFFAQDRSIGEVRDELHKTGHKFESRQLSPGLLAMTQDKTLSRSKNGDGKWVYRAGK